MIKPTHRRRSSVNFRGGAQNFCLKYMLNISKMPKFYMILAPKIIKIPEFYDMYPKFLRNSQILHDFCAKNARILHNNCPKNIFSRILGGHVPPSPLPPSATPMGQLTQIKLSKCIVYTLLIYPQSLYNRCHSQHHHKIVIMRVFSLVSWFTCYTHD